MTSIAFGKGHATKNDFVIIDDHEGLNPLSETEVRQLCDRHAGIGADGVLRVVKASQVSDWDGRTDLWFMDYRNADGSIAEMCGNGLRLFARHLIESQLVSGNSFEVATRAGTKQVLVADDGSISVNLGRVELGAEVEIQLPGSHWSARAADVGNPHAVVNLASKAELASLHLCEAPVWQPAQAFPNGANVEFYVERAPGDLVLRVHERGVGETQSCGTGIVAAVASYRRDSGQPGEIKVTVPGGELLVTTDDGGEYWLTGPAEIVATGEFWF